MSQQWNPLRELLILQDRMNRLFEDAAHRGVDTEGEGELENADWIPVADVYSREDEAIIAVDLPGIDRSALDITIDDNRLIIRGNRETEEGSRKTERPHGRFIRRFSLPGAIEQRGIHAEYKDGVLRVHLPKCKEQTAGRIEVKVS